MDSPQATVGRAGRIGLNGDFNYDYVKKRDPSGCTEDKSAYCKSEIIGTYWVCLESVWDKNALTNILGLSFVVNLN